MNRNLLTFCICLIIFFFVHSYFNFIFIIIIFILFFFGFCIYCILKPTRLLLLFNLILSNPCICYLLLLAFVYFILTILVFFFCFWFFSKLRAPTSTALQYLYFLFAKKIFLFLCHKYFFFKIQIYTNMYIVFIFIVQHTSFFGEKKCIQSFWLFTWIEYANISKRIQKSLLFAYILNIFIWLILQHDFFLIF